MTNAHLRVSMIGDCPVNALVDYAVLPGNPGGAGR
jgi:hypothetical protein